MEQLVKLSMCDMNREDISKSFDLVVSRLNLSLNPWDFHFTSEEMLGSHTGPFGSGFYVRGTTKIGIACRATLDNVYYQHSFITLNACSRETETFTIGHDTLMAALGRSDDSWLVMTNRQPTAVVARNGQDPVTAFVHDLTEIAAIVLRTPSEDFNTIVRRGHRAWTIE
ncbi:MAG: hypothetical protein AB7G28_18470 [Pirellulales bacterium]